MSFDFIYMMVHSPVKVWRKQKEVNRWLGKRGKIISFSKIHVPPMGFGNQAPYYIALIKFADGTSKMGQMVEITDSEMKTGLEVEGIIRRVREVDEEGVIPYGIKYKPL